MRAAAIDRFGGPAVLKVRRLPRPSPGPREVLIALDTAGVGGWDADMRKGWWPEGRPRFPLVFGTDGAGVVAAAGPRVRRLKKGDRVYAYSFSNPKGGFYAEYVTVRSDRTARIPKGLDNRSAGAMATTGLTALQGVDGALRVRRGQSIAIVGASGGVGTLAVQFAKLRGARVLAVASGLDGVRLARRLGADEAVDGRRGDVPGAVRRFAPEGLDGVLALTGGKTLSACLDALRKGGRLAYPNGVEPAPRKRSGVPTKSYNAVTGVREFERLRRAVEGAKLVVPIAASYPLARAADAHRRLERGHVLGKVTLRIR
jgi:NADPH:quinone reductase-like Zn-dependent oxidoreductase